MNTPPTREDQRISPPSDDIILSVQGLSLCFFTNRGVGQAVRDVSFDLRRGETLGLVGESGCGKSATVLSIVGLQPKATARITQGKVMFRGKDLVQMSARELRRYRGKHIAMVLQDPMTALNPVYTIGNQLFETLQLHLRLKRRRSSGGRQSTCLACCAFRRQRSASAAIRISSRAACDNASWAPSPSRFPGCAARRRTHNVARCHNRGGLSRPAKGHPADNRPLDYLHLT